MESVRELRERLQGPRRPYDTLYGRYVMRTFSIYLTRFFIPLPVTPLGVTFLSVIIGLAGTVFLSCGYWLTGLLLVNGWYLLDHVDGELARYRKSVSATGLYFDTIANAFIQPLTFAAIGIGLRNSSLPDRDLWVGLVAAYGAMMLLVIPYCEAAVLLQFGVLRDKGSSSAPNVPSTSILKRLFAGLHYLSAFPVVLPIYTVGVFVAKASYHELSFLSRANFASAVLFTVVWVGILANLAVSSKLESKVVKA